MNDPATDARRGIQSVVVGSRLLQVLATCSRSMSLTLLAQSAGMPPAKAHRYLVGYITAGLASRDEETGHYDLGPLALEIGLAALRRLDVVEIAGATMVNLRDEIGETVSMTVWGNRGPTLVRWVPSAAPVSITINIGSVLPLVTSSNGRVFAAYLPHAVTEAMITREISEPDGAARKAGLRSKRTVERMLQEVRDEGIARTDGLVLPGICSVSAPVFDHTGRIIAAVTVVGIHGMMDTAADATPSLALKRVANSLSRQMGYRPEQRL